MEADFNELVEILRDDMHLLSKFTISLTDFWKR